MDTGASLSVIKENAGIEFLDNNTTITLQGITGDEMHTLGTTILFLDEYQHHFHVVDNTFPVPGDGIIGLDFLTKFNCELNYGTQPFLIIRNSNGTCKKFLIQNSHDPHLLVIPARCEVIRKICFNTLNDDILIKNEEIKAGVFTASTITNAKNAYVRIINTTENITEVKINTIKAENFNNYEILKITENNLKLNDRNEEKIIMDKLKKNFPKFIEKDLTKLCKKYISIFNSKINSPIKAEPAKIILKDKEPIYIKNYRSPHSLKQETDKIINNLLNQNIIEESTSEYNSPIMIIPKKGYSTDKKWRMVVDYRKVNEKIASNRYPLPRIDEILDNLGSARFMCSLDLVDSFFQCGLEEKSRDITSFSTDKGSFRFTRLPQGLKISPNFFQKTMNQCFAGLIPEKAFLYMDDCVCFASSEAKMLKVLEEIFQICLKFNIKLNPEKCKFFMHEMHYLGHKCTQNGVLPDDSKNEKVKNYPIPQNKDEVKRFVAFVNFYRKFVPNFASYAIHLTRLTRKNAIFEWTSQCQTSFEYLKNSLLKPQILKYPNYNKEFCMTTDASDLACGAVLSQEYNGVQMPVAFASRKFLPGEKNKSVIERELAAICWALNYFKPYLYGNHFLVKTDHRPLVYLFGMKNPTSKLTRMRMELEDFDFTIEYIKGKDNIVADALSRIDFKEIKNLSKENENIIAVMTRSRTKALESNKDINKVNEDYNLQDPKIYEVLNNLEVKNYPTIHFNMKKLKCIVTYKKKIIIEFDLNEFIKNESLKLTSVLMKLENETKKKKIDKLKLGLGDPILECVSARTLKEIGNQILKELKIALTSKILQVTQENEKLELIKKYHDSPLLGGHSGIRRTYNKLKSNYSWYNMFKQIKNYIAKCEKCQKNKRNSTTKEPLQLTYTPQTAFDIVYIDTIGKLPISIDGNEYAITIICALTKFFVAIPIREKKAETIAKAIVENFIFLYGPFKKVITDSGTEYLNTVLKEVYKLLNIEDVSSTPYHHETVGLVERSHRTFNEYVRSFINEAKSDWDKWLKAFAFCYNITPSSTHGYTPFELVFAKKPTTFEFLQQNKIDPIYNHDSYMVELKYKLQIAHQRARKLIDKNKIIIKQQHDKNLNPISIKVNDLVLISNEARHKLEPWFKGPYKVVEIKDLNCVLEDNNSKQFLIHKNRLKKFQKIFYFRFYKT